MVASRLFLEHLSHTDCQGAVGALTFSLCGSDEKPTKEQARYSSDDNLKVVFTIEICLTDTK